MRSWIVHIPAYKRVEEIYYVEAEDEATAISVAADADADATLEDPDYYDLQPESATVELGSPGDDEPLTMTTTRAKLKALDDFLEEHGTAYTEFLSVVPQ